METNRNDIYPDVDMNQVDGVLEIICKVLEFILDKHKKEKCIEQR